jgi:hypothetical protein
MYGLLPLIAAVETIFGEYFNVDTARLKFDEAAEDIVD